MRGVIDEHDFSARRHHFVNDARRRRDDIHVVFAPEPFLDDLHVEQAEEAAAKPKAERDGAFRLINESRIVKPQFSDGGLEMLEVAGIDRIDSAENHRMNFLKARQRFARWVALIGNRVADFELGACS